MKSQLGHLEVVGECWSPLSWYTTGIFSFIEISSFNCLITVLLSPLLSLGLLKHKLPPVPPRFVDHLTSPSHVEVAEDSSVVSLRCVANGSPGLQIQWRREDGQPINMQSAKKEKGYQSLTSSSFFFFFLSFLFFLFLFTLSPLCVHLLVGSSFSLSLSLSPLCITGSALSGEFLNLTKVQRTDSGAYICIAVSKVL